MPISKLLQPKVLLILICALFLFTRLYKISEIPPSVYWDEASIGYNAYSILQDGKDEWGEVFPLHFRAFGEFKLPIYIYATAVSVKFFGLSEFSVRLPAVLFSLGVVLLTYLLAKRLWGSEVVGLLSSFFVSVSSWFFIFSRTGYEATAGLMFYLLGIYLFVEYKKNVWWILFSVISFILSIYSYNSFRIIVPLTLIILTALYYDTLVYHSKAKILVMISVVLILLSVIPIIRLIKSDSGAVRLQTVGIFSSDRKSEILLNFSKNYLSHFSLEFLVLNGDRNLRSQQAGFGQLYLPEVILLPLGLIYLVQKRSRYSFLSLILLLLGPIPAALTKESPHALRSISMIPFIAIISGFGVVQLLGWVKKERIVYGIMVIIFLVFFSNYFLSFLNTYPIKSSKDWQYGYKKIYTDFRNKFDKYDRIIIADEYAQPYIFALFYQKFDPEKFRMTVVRNNVGNWGFSTVASFDKFEFGKLDQLLNIKPGQSLIFAISDKISNLTPLGTIQDLDGEVVFWVYEK